MQLSRTTLRRGTFLLSHITLRDFSVNGASIYKVYPYPVRINEHVSCNIINYCDDNAIYKGRQFFILPRHLGGVFFKHWACINNRLTFHLCMWHGWILQAPASLLEALEQHLATLEGRKYVPSTPQPSKYVELTRNPSVILVPRNTFLCWRFYGFQFTSRCHRHIFAFPLFIPKNIITISSCSRLLFQLFCHDVLLALLFSPVNTFTRRKVFLTVSL